MRKEKAKTDKPQRTMGQRFSDLLDLPADVVLACPKVTVTGTRHLMIENYRGLMEYSQEAIRVQTSQQLISVTGRSMEICAITDTDILIEGVIESVRWE